MRIEQFEYLIAVEKYGTIIEAGRRLHVSSQAISSSVRTLEQELDLMLVSSGRHGSILTEEGALIANATRTFFEQIYAAKGKKLVEEMKGSMECPIVYSAGSLRNFWNPLVASLQKVAPFFHLDIVEEGYDHCLRQIDEGTEAFGFSYQVFWEEKPLYPFSETLELLRLYTCDVGIQVHRKNPLYDKKWISAENLQEIQVAAYSEKNGIEIKSPYQILIQQLFRPEQIMYCHNLAVKEAAVRFGSHVGVAFNPIYQPMEEDGLVKIIPLMENVIVYGGVLVRKDKIFTRNEEQFLAYIQHFAVSLCNVITRPRK